MDAGARPLAAAARPRDGDVGAAIVAHLEDEGWACYPAAAASGILDARLFGIDDIVAIKPALAMAIAAGRSLSLRLIWRAARWSTVFPLILAVGGAQPRWLEHAALRRAAGLSLGVGLAVAAADDAWPCLRVVQPLRPRPRNLGNAERIRRAVEPMARLPAPATRAKSRRSVHEETMFKVRVLLARCGALPLKCLFDGIEGSCRHHYSSRASFVSEFMAATSPDRATGMVREPDIRREGGSVGWAIARCLKPKEYVDRVLAAAGRRRQPRGPDARGEPGSAPSRPFLRTGAGKMHGQRALGDII